MAIVTNADRRIDEFRKTGNGFKRDHSLYTSVHVTKWEDDFLGDVIRDQYTIVIGGTADAADIVAGQANGVLRIDSGTDDDNVASVELGRNWKGDLNCVAEARIASEAVADCKIVFGFTDELYATDAAGPINVLATPSINASDCAVWVLDTDDTGNLELQAVSAKGGAILTKLEPSAASTGPTFVAGEYLTLTVACRGDFTRFIAAMDAADVAGTGVDEPYFDSGWLAIGIEGGTNLNPILESTTRNGGAGNYIDVDYLNVWQSRV